MVFGLRVLGVEGGVILGSGASIGFKAFFGVQGFRGSVFGGEFGVHLGFVGFRAFGYTETTVECAYAAAICSN